MGVSREICHHLMLNTESGQSDKRQSSLQVCSHSKFVSAFKTQRIEMRINVERNVKWNEGGKGLRLC